MKMPLLLALPLLMWGAEAMGQEKQWIVFGDKGPEAQEWLAHPERFLSQRALDRRLKHGVAVTNMDLPLSRTYLAQLSGLGIQVHGRSKWLNAVSAPTDLTLAQVQAACPAVVAMLPVGKMKASHATQADFMPVPMPSSPPPPWVWDYGASLNQLDIINAPCLHNRGYTGRGVLLAQFDSGFEDVNTIDAFDSLRNEGRLVKVYDFVNHDTTVFDEDWHGLAVLSTFAALKPGSYVGASPHVSVALARTETVFSETHQEEDNWLMGAEWADSMGADIIQSSLGYYQFDGGQGDYTYADMDGNTTIISKAADWAASRGILVCNSAGNEGSSAWHYIIAPCDGDSVLCVGGVDNNLNISSFSSIGPSSDQQVKPDVVAMATSAAVVAFGGNVGNFNGTSFSAPQMAGLAACLIQAHPQRSNMDIIRALQQSADRYTSPDTAFGYGVPDGCKADSILSVLDSLAQSSTDLAAYSSAMQVFPNPATQQLTVTLPDNRLQATHFSVTTTDGKRLLQTQARPGQGTHQIDLQGIPSGHYLLEVHLKGGKVAARKFIRN